MQQQINLVKKGFTALTKVLFKKKKNLNIYLQYVWNCFLYVHQKLALCKMKKTPIRRFLNNNTVSEGTC